ncbi:hypothetical protein GP486_004841 [Trichoglossum hirsutum]|uniref:N-acetyltransferase domain-containing protein n=1 Tax=Trichoglossum hirsutum TaxID=265104 RepID=A0A9P8RNC9_9PEZI|nr:hypothetical protein GP486_004841 [Trichoglossum hirsutum]
MEQTVTTAVVESVQALNGRAGKAIYTPDEVRILTIDEYHEAARCLALAFAKDEVARYFIDTKDMADCSEEEKWNLHVNILEYIVAAHCYSGVVTAIGSNYDAVALWWVLCPSRFAVGVQADRVRMPPGKNLDDWLTILRSGLWRLHYKLSAEGRKRFFSEFLPLLHDTKQDILGERDDHSYYLVYLGSRPSSRGKGYAKKLVQYMTKKADVENLPTYLECSANANVEYYEKFGFELRRKVYLFRGEKPVGLDIMVREPPSRRDPTVNGPARPV